MVQDSRIQPSTDQVSGLQKILLKCGQGQQAEALNDLKRGIPAHRDQPQWLMVGLQLALDMGELGVAHEFHSLAGALSVCKNNAYFYFLSGRLSHCRLDYQSAATAFKTSLELDANLEFARFNLALTQQALGELSSALQLLDTPFKDEALQVQSLVLRGNLLLDLGRPREALDEIRSVQVAAPRDLHVLDALIRALLANSQMQQAEQIVESLEIESIGPSHPIQLAISKFHRDRGDLNSAAAVLQRSMNVEPSPLLALSLANIRADEGLLSEATQLFQAVSCDAGATDRERTAAKLGIACLSLRHRSTPDAWEMYFDGHTPLRHDLSRRISVSAWSGEISEHLIIWGDQGLGDQLLFSRKLLNIRQTHSITLVVDEVIKGLLKDYVESGELVCELLSHREFMGYVVPSNARLCLLSDVPHVLKIFTPPPTPPGHKKRDVSGPLPLRIGLCWHSDAPETGRWKSIDLGSLVSGIVSDELGADVALFNFQHGKSAEDWLVLRDRKYSEMLRRPFCKLSSDFGAPTAKRLTESTDLLVTISSSIAHLAGCLNHPTILLSPKGRGGFWYWSRQPGGHASTEYPSVQILEQSTPGNWIEPLRQLPQLIRNFI